MSNDALNAHIQFGEPCGPDAELSQIADWAGSLLLEENKETEKLRARVDELEAHLKSQTESEEVFTYPNDWIKTMRILEKDWK